MVLSGDDLRKILGPNMSAAHKFVSTLIDKHPMNKRFRSQELESLVPHHPTKRIVGKTLGLVRSKRPPYNRPCLYVVVESTPGYERTEELGWVRCIRELYGLTNKDKDLQLRCIEAMRNEAFKGGAMQKARARFTQGACSICKKLCKLAIDHDGKPFAQIADEWLKRMEKTLLTLKTHCSSGARVFKDRPLAKSWVDFHDSEASLQGLCRSCNSSKGSGGYRRNPKKEVKADPGPEVSPPQALSPPDRPDGQL